MYMYITYKISGFNVSLPMDHIPSHLDDPSHFLLPTNQWLFRPLVHGSYFKIDDSMDNTIHVQRPLYIDDSLDHIVYLYIGELDNKA